MTRSHTDRRRLAAAALIAGAAIAAVAGAGCTVVSLDEYPCPRGGTKLTYESFGAPFMAAYCNRCHSAPDGQRYGAPDGYVFDTRDGVLAHRDRIFVRAADTNNSMPPGPDMIPASARVDLADWLACGAP